MKQEINPRDTSRAYAFEMWMNAPMPMVTFFKTLNVSRLVKISRKLAMRPAFGRLPPEGRMKFNMLMCWCIGKAASKVNEFYLLPVDGKLMQFDTIAVNTIVANFNNPFLIWGKYKRCLLKTTLSVSFQFHHTQMDGAHAARFLDELQKVMNTL